MFNKADYTDGIIDLYLSEQDLVRNAFCYHIYLHNSDIFIGYITYHSNKKEKDLNGDVGYEIFKPYQGNNYALNALKLLSLKIKEIGDENFEIYAETTNIASIKTIENYGGLIISKNKKMIKYLCNSK